MIITDLRNPWRDTIRFPGSFRGVPFYVEQSGRGGGRRVALHQYPKRDIPYAEDMGRTAWQITVQGYIITSPANPVMGPNYLTVKDLLIDALEQDGPGTLVIPLEYKLTDMTVMVMSYSVTESREKGGMCAVEMVFVEYGDGNYRPTISAPIQVEQSATAVESAVQGTPTPTTPQEVAPYIPPFTGF